MTDVLPDFLPGDIAACYGTSLTSRVIRYGTASLFGPPRLRIGPSHVAIICHHQDQATWVDATTLCARPCIIQRTCVEGVQAQRPVDRIRDYVRQGGRVEMYRLSPIDRLSDRESRLLTRILLHQFLGVRYDLGGAMLSGTRWLQRTHLLPSADLNELFCSELVAALLMRLGRLNRANPTRYNPARLLRQLVWEGTYQFETEFTPPVRG